MLTLFTTPVIYLYLDRFQTWLQRREAPSMRKRRRISALPRNERAGCGNVDRKDSMAGTN